MRRILLRAVVRFFSLAGRKGMIKHKLSVENLLAIGDARDIPTYSIPLAARYLHLPIATLRAWVRGRKYPLKGGQGTFEPLIRVPDRKLPLLSFYNLAEAHVLSAFRREHGIPIPAIRSALEYVVNKFGWERPLIQQQFQTDGVGLLVEQLGEFVDASRGGQKVMREWLDERLQRLEWEHDLVARLYPFTRSRIEESPKLVLIDSFGQPCLVQSRIATAVVAERYKAGDSVDHLAHDYACPREEIEEAIRCELSVALAA
jgi:uncharacterized protein (DUF433 family)